MKIFNIIIILLICSISCSKNIDDNEFLVDMNELRSSGQIISNPIKNDIVFESQIKQTIYSFIPNITEYGDQMGVIRVAGFTIKDIGAADRQFDCLKFVVLNTYGIENSILKNRFTTEDYIIEYKKYKTMYIQVPHIIDPSHIVKKSKVNNTVDLIINLFPDLRVGGWNYNNQVMMYQNTLEIKQKYIDDYSDSDYIHFYDNQ